MMDIKGTVTISIEDFDNIRKQYDDLMCKIKSTYKVHDGEMLNDVYMELEINNFLELVEELDPSIRYNKFQRQEENIIIGIERFEPINDDDIPF